MAIHEMKREQRKLFSLENLSSAKKKKEKWNILFSFTFFDILYFNLLFWLYGNYANKTIRKSFVFF